MGGRTMPVDCPHGGIADWGGFGDEWEPYRGLCPECVPPETVWPLTADYRDWNRGWLEEFHREWYAARDAEAVTVGRDQ